MLLPRKHVFIESTHSVNDACSSLFKKTPIKCFTYGKFYDDGRCFIITSNWEWLPHYFEKEYPLTAPVKYEEIKKQFFHISENYSNYRDTALSDSKKFFGYAHFIDLIEISRGYYEMFSFGAKANDEGVYDFYINNLSILEKFKHLFISSIGDIVKNRKEETIILPFAMRSNFNSKANQKVLQIYKEDLFPESSTNSWLKNSEGQDVPISHREKECLFYLSRGYSAKKTALAMGISPRTVETFIHRVKIKLGCHYKMDIIEYVLGKFNFNNQGIQKT